MTLSVTSILGVEKRKKKQRVDFFWMKTINNMNCCFSSTSSQMLWWCDNKEFACSKFFVLFFKCTSINLFFFLLYTLQDDLKRYQPHYLISVPLVFETLYRYVLYEKLYEYSLSWWWYIKQEKDWIDAWTRFLHKCFWGK